jgi:hypothetical protein
MRLEKCLRLVRRIRLRLSTNHRRLDQCKLPLQVETTSERPSAVSFPGTSGLYYCSTAVHRKLAARATYAEFGPFIIQSYFERNVLCLGIVQSIQLSLPVAPRSRNISIDDKRQDLGSAQPLVESGHIGIDGVALATRTRYRSGGRARASLARLESRVRQLGPSDTRRFRIVCRYG